MRGVSFVSAAALAAMCFAANPLGARQYGSGVLTDVEMTPKQTAGSTLLCQQDANPSLRIMLERAEDMEDLIAEVPPAEVSAMVGGLVTEEGDATRFATFKRNHPLYASMKAHNALQDFRIDLGKLDAMNKDSPKTRIMAATGLIGDSVAVDRTWKDFANSPPARSVPPAAMKKWNLNSSMTGIVERYIWCRALAIKH
jgi:hypothetical protein